MQGRHALAPARVRWQGARGNTGGGAPTEEGRGARALLALEQRSSLQSAAVGEGERQLEAEEPREEERARGGLGEGGER